MTDTRLTADEVALLRDRLPVGYHINEELLRKVATEYLRITEQVFERRYVRLHHSMTTLRDWLIQRLKKWPRVDQDDMDEVTLRRLFALDTAWSADTDIQRCIIAMHDAARKAGNT